MRTTFVLNLDEDLSDFLEGQSGLVDPSAFVNQLLHAEMQRQGWQPGKGHPARQQGNDVMVAMEQFLDEDTHAAE